MVQEVAIPDHMTKWDGSGDHLSPPDWNQKEVLFSDGTMGMPIGNQWHPFQDKVVLAYNRIHPFDALGHDWDGVNPPPLHLQN